MRGLSLIAAYTWLPTFEATKSADPNEIGQRQPTVPEHMASLWLHYRLQNGPLAGFGFGGGVRYIGETFGNIAHDADMMVPSFTLFDGVVDYERYGWRFAAQRQQHRRRDDLHLLGHLLLRHRPHRHCLGALPLVTLRPDARRALSRARPGARRSWRRPPRPRPSSGW